MRHRIDMGSLLEQRAEERPEKLFLAMVENDWRFSYRQFNERSNEIAHGLRATGVGTGDYVCLLLGSSPEFLLVSYALKKIGAVEVSVNAEFRLAVVSFRCRAFRNTERALDQWHGGASQPIQRLPVLGRSSRGWRHLVHGGGLGAENPLGATGPRG